MVGDAELVQRAAAGDREAAGQIYDRHAPLVRAVLQDATGSLAEANDLLQSVFLRALGRLKQLRRGDYLCGWLLGIARREAVDYRRRMARQRNRVAPLVEDPPERFDEAAHETVQAVRDAISLLPERERLAVHIHYLCEAPVEVARQTLGLSPAGFYKLLERARERLRARLVKTEERR